MSVTRFRRKPATDEAEQAAAKYEPGKSLFYLESVALMAAGTVYEMAYHRGHILIGVWDDDDGHPQAVIIRAGHWLAYSTGHGFLYESTDADWQQFYDEVPGDPAS